MSTSELSLSGITINAANPQALASFWAAAVGGEPAGNDSDMFLSSDAGNGLRFHFHRSTTTTADEQKMHLDFRVEWGKREAEAERLIGLGATLRWEVLDEHPGMRLSVLADPENNLFCVVEVQSA
ncbi:MULTISPECIES: VOC family protein [unclassified Arthrobacter]|uniref:VOC family protein n=1 Tax=unclassified Arthrobacter TaxID=235627 RepID=UPI001D13EE54|nr:MULTISPECIES: VOC family protein [unclassified Arthrobacter]MCC3275358.1 VOC family protein [Arthrobacter sp. zg-Y20]MCC9176804.1 VOC family protein [Arthrobacter sp. zg-Y750]MDK1315517.1 VOC family protein [Arthrobacter sp. zg.Y20]WIB05932.1 VOC family protein [Arthrobacter sp. zg-Y20]